MKTNKKQFQLLSSMTPSEVFKIVLEAYQLGIREIQSTHFCRRDKEYTNTVLGLSFTIYRAKKRTFVIGVWHEGQFYNICSGGKDMMLLTRPFLESMEACTGQTRSEWIAKGVIGSITSLRKISTKASEVLVYLQSGVAVGVYDSSARTISLNTFASDDMFIDHQLGIQSEV